jgi:hypothetical protein
LFETDGIFLAADKQTPEEIAAQWDAVNDTSNQHNLESGGKQTEKFLTKAMSQLSAQA